MTAHAQLLEEIRLAAAKVGLIAISHADSRRDALWDPGFPDVVIANPRGNGMIFAEVKVGGDTLSHGQQVWRRALQANGCYYTIWREADHPSGLIERMLDDLSR